MAYNELLADRIRTLLPDSYSIEEKKMMGGLTFMVNGKMCIGVINDNLMCRIAPDNYETALAHKGCREMDFTGRPMKGYIFVSPEDTDTQQGLSHWVDLALQFNSRAKASKKTGKKAIKI